MINNNSSKKSNLKKFLAIIFTISVISSKISVFADNADENIRKFGYRNTQKSKYELNLQKKYKKLMCYVVELLKEVSNNNKKNNYSIFITAIRRVLSRNKTSVERAFESSQLYKKTKRNVTCWDASLAFLFNLYSKYGPYGYEKELFYDMQIGLLSYNIAGASLANHVFCYFLVNNVLHLVDPLLGYYIDIHLGLSDKEIKKRINKFYEIQRNSSVIGGLLGNIFDKIYEISEKNHKTKSQFGKDGVLVSNNIFDKENMKLSEVKWMSDIPFYTYLIKNKKIPNSNHFRLGCNCKTFG